MLSCPPTRINLTAADISDFERRWARRRPMIPRPARLASGPARLTKQSYVPASANRVGRWAESHSSHATIHPVHGEDSGNQDLDAAVAIESSENIRTASDQLLAQTRVFHRPVSAATISLADPPPTNRSPKKPPQDFTIHEEETLLQAETEARQLRRPHIFRRAVEEQVNQQIANSPEVARSGPRTLTTSLLVGQPVEERPQSSAPLDPGAPIFVPEGRHATTVDLGPDSSHRGIEHQQVRINPEASHPSPQLRIRSSFERNSQRSSNEAEHVSTSSNSLDALPAVRMVQARRRSRTNDQNAAIQRVIPDLGRYPAMPQLQNMAAGARRNSVTPRRIVLPRRRSSQAPMADLECPRSSSTAIQPNARAMRVDLLSQEKDRFNAPSPAPSTSSRSTPNLLTRPHPAVIPHPRSSSFSWNSANRLHSQPSRLSSVSGASSTSSAPNRTPENDLLNRMSPLDDLARNLGRFRPRSVGRSWERPPAGRARPSLLNGDPFRLDSYERPEQQCSPLVSPIRGGSTPCPGQSVKRDAEHIESPPPAVIRTARCVQTGSSLNSVLEDPVAVTLALPPLDLPLSPASTPLPYSLPPSPHSPRLVSSPNSGITPSTPPVRASAISSPQSSTFAGCPSTSARSSLTIIPHSLDATVTPKVPVYHDSRSPTLQPQTPADVTRSSRRFRPLSDTSRLPRPSMATTAATPSHRDPYRSTFIAVTPPRAPAANSGMTPARAPAVALQTPSVQWQSFATLVDHVEDDMNDMILESIERDRRTWIERREDGTLDVTPPKEGRFERYVSDGSA